MIKGFHGEIRKISKPLAQNKNILAMILSH